MSTEKGDGQTRDGRLNLRLPKKLLADVRKKIEREENRTINNWIETVLKAHLDGRLDITPPS